MNARPLVATKISRSPSSWRSDMQAARSHTSVRSSQIRGRVTTHRRERPVHMMRKIESHSKATFMAMWRSHDTKTDLQTDTGHGSHRRESCSGVIAPLQEQSRHVTEYITKIRGYEQKCQKVAKGHSAVNTCYYEPENPALSMSEAAVVRQDRYASCTTNTCRALALLSRQEGPIIRTRLSFRRLALRFTAFSLNGRLLGCAPVGMRKRSSPAGAAA